MSTQREEWVHVIILSTHMSTQREEWVHVIFAEGYITLIGRR